jgi:8-oxo-dGTP pyrophosphatase MutT (NUDIX family)
VSRAAAGHCGDAARLARLDGVQPIARVAARVVLVDPGGAFLLIRSHDPDLPRGSTWWHVPGGGLDSGETPEQAAVREVREEVGVDLPAVGPCVGTRTTRFTFTGRDYVQEESFFVVRLESRVDVATDAWTDVERRATLGWRWWTIDELGRCRETVYPPGLAAMVGAWLRDGPPAAPMRLA